MSFDSNCYDLAEHFLADEAALLTERNKRRLAQHIQDTIEDWIACEREDPLPEANSPTPETVSGGNTGEKNDG